MIRTLAGIVGVILLAIGLYRGDPWPVLVGLVCAVYWLLSEREEG